MMGFIFLETDTLKKKEIYNKARRQPLCIALFILLLILQSSCPGETLWQHLVYICCSSNRTVHALSVALGSFVLQAHVSIARISKRYFFEHSTHWKNFLLLATWRNCVWCLFKLVWREKVLLQVAEFDRLASYKWTWLRRALVTDRPSADCTSWRIAEQRILHDDHRPLGRTVGCIMAMRDKTRPYWFRHQIIWSQSPNSTPCLSIRCWFSKDCDSPRSYLHA